MLIMHKFVVLPVLFCSVLFTTHLIYTVINFFNFSYFPLHLYIPHAINTATPIYSCILTTCHNVSPVTAGAKNTLNISKLRGTLTDHIWHHSFFGIFHRPYLK
jgi:hypothetical protein